MTRPGESCFAKFATGRVCSPESPVDERATDGGTNTQRRQRRRKNVQQPSTINHQPPLSYLEAAWLRYWIYALRAAR